MQFAQSKEENGETEYLNYLKNDPNKDVRKVNLDAIITTIRRQRKEDYIIYIVPNSINSNLTYITEENGFIVNPKSNLNFGERTISTTDRIIELLPGNRKMLYNDNEENNTAEQGININFLNDLYKIANEKNYLEYIGVYKEKEEGVLEAEKKLRQIITFVEEN